MKTFIKTITTSAVLLLVTGCASTDKNAPINDDYSTSFRWSEYDSTALNLLRSADMDTKYDDVNSKEDISDIRDRNSTAGNILGNALNFSAFGVGGLLYSVGQNDDDLDPKFGGVTYVTYVPVHTDDLSLQEQLSVREKAITNLTTTLLKSGSDVSKFVPTRTKSIYKTDISGEICDVTRPAHFDSRFPACILGILVSIRKVIKTEKYPTYIKDKVSAPYLASVSIVIGNSLMGVAMTKNIQGNDFIAFPDLFDSNSEKIMTNVPVVVQNNKIHSFFTPSHNVTPYNSGDAYLVNYFKEEKRIFKMPILTNDEPSVMTEVPVNK
jgi:hypothetical protein